MSAAFRRRVAPCLVVAAWVIVPGAWASTSTVAAQQQADEALEVTLIRTWAPEDLTVVDGLANVPLEMLAGGTTGAYRFELSVFDATDTQLYRDSWERQLSQQAAAYVESGTSYLLEPFRFGVRPGEYEVEIRAYPTDAPDLGERVRLPLVAFDERPASSDLFLASRIEPITEGAGGGSWSVTHGGFGIAAAARMSVLPTEPDLYYYLELYGLDEETTRVSINAEVMSGERVVYRTPVSEVEVVSGGVPFTGHLSLAGLPPGEYQLAMTVGDELEGQRRLASFEMLSPDHAVAAGTATGSYEADYFATLSDEELEQTFGGVALLITNTERSTFEALPPDAKRRYLTEFFQRQDPNPGTPGNAFLDDYLNRIATIRARYDETVGTEERMPWYTDRGRIYLKYGEPQDRVVNYSPSDLGSPTQTYGGAFAGEPPYEIWQYQMTSFVYLFIQDDRFDHWRLIYSTDPNVASLADWYNRCGPSALQDLQTNFGINTRFITGLDN
jgi:GWxTD domain-containing protein